MPEEIIDWPAWIGRHGPVAFLYAMQFGCTRADAEDAVHEGFIRFWAKRHSARHAPALFFASVRTAVLDQRRAESRRRKRERAHTVVVPLLMTREGPGESEELRERIERALRELPEPQREVAVLKVWGDLTFAQIAEMLAESPNTVATRYRYAMEKLELLLSPEYGHGK